MSEPRCPDDVSTAISTVPCDAKGCRQLATRGIMCESPTLSDCPLMYAFCECHLAQFVKNSQGEEYEIISLDEIW